VLKLAVSNAFHRHEETHAEVAYYRQLNSGATKHRPILANSGRESLSSSTDDDTNEFSTYSYVLSKAIRTSFVILGPLVGLQTLEHLLKQVRLN